ncbi:MAG: prepilin-type N-terminal cleavage/methylation domain-containing protein [Myxococcota bacterium]|nr:prepilin-type N-terminal cleavage/methylation domain-containing protein [Myxococcota bacterium]
MPVRPSASRLRNLHKAAGFTIMEVMVAIMILAVSVVSIFGAQFAAVATTDFARYTTQAIELARCRMSEIELEIQTENGFEEADVISSGDCCELLESEPGIDAFECAWEIKAVELPDIATLMSDADGGGGFLGDFGLGGGGMGAGDPADNMAEMDEMGIVSSFAPMLSDMLRQAMRRVTVTVEWEQGPRKRQFVLSQYLTHPTQGPLEFMHGAASAAEMSEAIQEGDMTSPFGPSESQSDRPSPRPGKPK